MKKLVVIFAMPDIAKLVSVIYLQKTDQVYDVSIIEIDKPHTLLGKEQIELIESADIISVQYDTKLKDFAKQIADCLESRSLLNKKLPKFQLWYDVKLCGNVQELKDLITNTKQRYLIELFYPYLSTSADEMMRISFEKVNVGVVKVETDDDVSYTPEPSKN